MASDCRNIYRTVRTIAGLTQERWAEAIGVSPESIRGYESGRQLPPDEVVIAMIESSGHHILGYQHLLSRSRVAAGLLPQVDKLPLAQAVVQLLVAMEDFAADHASLLKIAADGTIDYEERRSWEKIASDLDEVVKAGLQLKFAEGGGEG